VIIICQAGECMQPATVCHHTQLFATAYATDRTVAKVPMGRAFYYYCAAHEPDFPRSTDMSSTDVRHYLDNAAPMG
jgi:hypothetical protein